MFGESLHPPLPLRCIIVDSRAEEGFRGAVKLGSIMMHWIIEDYISRAGSQLKAPDDQNKESKTKIFLKNHRHSVVSKDTDILSACKYTYQLAYVASLREINSLPYLHSSSNFHSPPSLTTFTFDGYALFDGTITV